MTDSLDSPKEDADIFCPYLGERVPRAKTTPEHILPRAIGGGLTIRVDAGLNSKAGGDVDKPFVDSDVIKTLRVNYGIMNQGGEPELVVPHDFSINGEPVPGQIVYRPGGKREIEIPPDVVRDGNYWLSTFITQSPEDSEEQHKRQLEKRLEALRKKHGADAEFDLDSLRDPPQRTQVELPPPVLTAKLPCEVIYRFMAKVALAATTKQFGEAWGRSAHATALRSVVFGNGDFRAPPIRGRGYRVPEEQQGKVNLMTCFSSLPEEHEISYFPCDGGMYCVVLIFHLIGAVIRISDTEDAPKGWAIRFRLPKEARRLEGTPMRVPLQTAFDAAQKAGEHPSGGLLCLAPLDARSTAADGPQAP